MIRNLFSIFDTNTNSICEINWTSSITIIIIYPLNYWILPSKKFTILYTTYIILYKEFKIILRNKFNYLNSIYIITLFLIILLNNIIGLFPYIFTNSSHIIFSLRFSIPVWIRLITFRWINNINTIFSHLIPQGTPNILIPFIVIIETIRIIIRPGTLSIRLTANIIAGHLLLTLLRQRATHNSIFFSISIIITQIILLILEFRVSIIQAYVFTILTTLYIKEIN